MYLTNEATVRSPTDSFNTLSSKMTKKFDNIHRFISQYLSFISYKFGIIGLVEEEWILDVIDERFIYRDFVTEGKKLAKDLKEKVLDLKLEILCHPILYYPIYSF